MFPHNQMLLQVSVMFHELHPMIVGLVALTNIMSLIEAE